METLSIKRIIVDYKKLNDTILDLLVQRYPDGYTTKDIICFKNKEGDWVESVEVRTEDTVYLVKISKRLEQAISDYEEDEEDDDYYDSEDDVDTEVSTDLEMAEDY